MQIRLAGRVRQLLVHAYRASFPDARRVDAAHALALFIRHVLSSPSPSHPSCRVLSYYSRIPFEFFSDALLPDPGKRLRSVTFEMTAAECEISRQLFA